MRFTACREMAKTSHCVLAESQLPDNATLTQNSRAVLTQIDVHHWFKFDAFTTLCTRGVKVGAGAFSCAGGVHVSLCLSHSSSIYKYR